MKSDKDILIALIGTSKYEKLQSKIPAKYTQEIVINYSLYLLSKSNQEILDFYSELINSNRQWPVPKMGGSIMILTTHIHDLLKKLVDVNEQDSKLVKKIHGFNLNLLIMFCTARYDIPDEYFIELIKLKHFRNMVAHDFNSVMETGFQEFILPISEGSLLVNFIVDIIRCSKPEK